MKNFKFLLLAFAALFLSVSFTACGDDDDDEKDNPNKITQDQIYVGVVAFNKNVKEKPITNDLESVKSFIREQTNDEDATAFAYSVSRGNKMFDAAGLPEFDKIFMLNFSDGTDNYSNRLWGDEGRIESPTMVYDAARSDLLGRAGLNSYALGFGDDVGFGEQMKKIVMGGGSYYKASKSSDLQPTFNEIANSIIASAKNVVLKTNSGYYDEANPKYFRFSFRTEDETTDRIDAKMVGTPQGGYTLTVVKSGTYAKFDNPVKGQLDSESGKVILPLNNLKFVQNGVEVSFDLSKVEVSFDNTLYYGDVEEASTAESVSKRIAVVLVLDCSKSMNDAFGPMKDAAIDFIETLQKMNLTVDETTSDSGITDNSHMENGYQAVDLGLPSGILWATCNVGATVPGEYGSYFAWGETTTKSSYTSSNYSYKENPGVLPLANDAARANWGGTWRMPTTADYDELRNSCTWTWTKQNSSYGYKVVGPNGKNIFLPAAGYRSGSSLGNAGSYGYYWSSSFLDSYNAFELYFKSSDCNTYRSDRYHGLSVRAVCE